VRPFAAARLGACLALLGGAGCVPERGVGYVEIKVFPATSAPLYLNATRIDPPRGNSAVLRQQVGKTTLQLERNGQLLSLCDFVVRKNRITTVTVSTGRDPRCRVQG
jgi:hypothetical protein